MLFPSWFLGGFECSTHRRWDGRRLDVSRSSRHEELAAADYRRLAKLGLLAARDGVRWHRAETRPGVYDFSHDLPLVRAARGAGVQVIWDLCHYGWPDDLDVFTPAFVDRFAAFAGAFARVVAGESDAVPWYAPVNEISFFAWAAGEVAYIGPFARGRGGALKAQLVRAAIAATEAVREVDSRARIVHADPVIRVVPNPELADGEAGAAAFTEAQWEAWDMLAGRAAPELGGSPEYLDVVGVNYYPHNQWVHHPGAGFNPSFAIARSDPRYRPFRELLGEVWERYRRPLFIAETGDEGPARPEWLRYVGEEARAAMRAGVPLGGICWYPILNHPGWDDERHCANGMWDYADAAGARTVYRPLADEMERQQRLFAATLSRPQRGRASPVCP